MPVGWAVGRNLKDHVDEREAAPSRDEFFAAYAACMKPDGEER